MAISAWKRKPHTQLISVIDLIFPILMLVLHTYNFSIQERRQLEPIRGLIDTDQHWGVYVLLWIIIYLGNILEVYIAFQLFNSLRPDYADAALVVAKSERWLRYSSIVFLGLLIKFLLFMIFLGKFGRVDAFSLIICLIDIIFRMTSVYMVKRFLDDVKSQLPARKPSVYFINLPNLLSSTPTRLA